MLSRSPVAEHSDERAFPWQLCVQPPSNAVNQSYLVEIIDGWEYA